MILTLRGAHKEFDKLFSRLESVKVRLENWSEDLDQSSELGFDTAESDDLVHQLQLGRMQMQAALRQARAGVELGSFHWRATAPLLKECRREIDVLEAHLDKLDAINTAASKNARSTFGL